MIWKPLSRANQKLEKSEEHSLSMLPDLLFFVLSLTESFKGEDKNVVAVDRTLDFPHPTKIAQCSSTHEGHGTFTVRFWSILTSSVGTQN